MGGVGDKAAADLLGGLKAVSELIELLCQVGQFVLPRRLKAVAVLPLAHHPDGPKQRPDAGGEHPGKERAHRQGDHRQHQGDGAQVLLQAHEQRPLGVVPVADIDAADGHAPVQNGGGGGGEKHPVLIVGVEHVVPLEGQGHLLKQGVLIGRLGGGGAPPASGGDWAEDACPLALLALGELSYRISPEGSVTRMRSNPMLSSMFITRATWSAERVSNSMRAEDMTAI